jgi:hypothetical protein
MYELRFPVWQKLCRNSSFRLFFLHVYCLHNRFNRSNGGWLVIMSFRLFSSYLIFQQQGLKLRQVILVIRRSVTIHSVGKLQYLTLVSFSAQKFAQPCCCYLRNMFKSTCMKGKWLLLCDIHVSLIHIVLWWAWSYKKFVRLKIGTMKICIL